MGEDERTEKGISRRSALKRIGAAGAIAWATPVISSLRTPAYAASPANQSCQDGWTCQPPGAAPSCGQGPFGVGCFCGITDQGNICVNDFPCDNPNCTTSADCGPGGVCVTVSCCGQVGICTTPCAAPAESRLLPSSSLTTGRTGGGAGRTGGGA